MEKLRGNFFRFQTLTDSPGEKETTHRCHCDRRSVFIRCSVREKEWRQSFRNRDSKLTANSQWRIWRWFDLVQDYFSEKKTIILTKSLFSPKKSFIFKIFQLSWKIGVYLGVYLDVRHDPKCILVKWWFLFLKKNTARFMIVKSWQNYDFWNSPQKMFWWHACVKNVVRLRFLKYEKK